jgi:hypothetical protein
MMPPRARAALRAAAVLALLAWAPAASAQFCEGKQSYSFTFSMDWTDAVDAARPPNAAITHVLAVAHSREYSLWEEGGQTSPAVAELLRDRKTAKFEAVVGAKQKEKVVADYAVAGTSLNRAVGDVKFELTLDGAINGTHVSVLAGLVPSPGWFVARLSFPLCDEKRAKFLPENTEDMSLIGYNSGLSRGTQYTDAFDAYTEAERKPIFLLKEVSVGKFGVLQMQQEAGSSGGGSSGSGGGGGGSGRMGWAIGGGVAGALALAAVCIFCVLRRRKGGPAALVPDRDTGVEDGDVDW